MTAHDAAGPQWLMDRLRHFNKRVTNPLMLTFAGRRVYAAIRHVGRRSGRTYTTPVLAAPVEGGFVIPLPYGEGVDWCRNVLAAGGCSMQWQGKMYALIEPQLVDPQAALPFFPGWLQFMLRRTKRFLKVRQAESLAGV